MPRILVVSIPRCGSTMVFRAIAGLDPGSVTPRDYDGPHIKSHSFEPSAFVGRVDVAVFLFGDIVASVASTRERRNTAEHFRNCGAASVDPATVDLFAGDHLNYERMYDSWMVPGPIPHVCVRYERLHELSPAVSFLLGTPLALPEYRARRGAQGLSRADRQKIRTGYASLRRKISKAPDLQWWG